MNTKRLIPMLFLLLVVVLGVAASFMVLNPATAAARQSQEFSPLPVTLLDEPGPRMWSGPIQFADGNMPDFRPRVKTSAEKAVMPDCMADEQVTRRRQGGCIQ